MSATFTTKVTGVRVHDLGNLTKVVKQIEFVVTGTQDGQTFELPQSLVVPDADGTNFVPFEQLTEQQVVAWINEHFENMPSVQAHIQYVLDKEVAKAALAQEALPWAPAPAPAPAPTTPPAQ